jgi:hypothetical protein
MYRVTWQIEGKAFAKDYERKTQAEKAAAMVKELVPGADAIEVWKKIVMDQTDLIETE